MSTRPERAERIHVRPVEAGEHLRRPGLRLPDPLHVAPAEELAADAADVQGGAAHRVRHPVPRADDTLVPVHVLPEPPPPRLEGELLRRLGRVLGLHGRRPDAFVRESRGASDGRGALDLGTVGRTVGPEEDDVVEAGRLGQRQAQARVLASAERQAHGSAEPPHRPEVAGELLGDLVPLSRREVVAPALLGRLGPQPHRRAGDGDPLPPPLDPSLDPRGQIPRRP